MTKLTGKNIAVLKGGPGSEREVSFATAAGVTKALRSLGANVTEIDVRDENFQLPSSTDLAFLAIHGTFGEDGRLQKILEDRGIPYTGDGVEASQRAFDKIRSKECFHHEKVPTPPWQVIEPSTRPTLSLPIVIKPPREGSTVGVHIIKSEPEIGAAIADVARFGSDILVEKFIAGRELTVGILGDQALPIIEIIPKGGFYDFTNKYPFLNPKAGGSAQHICPAHIDPDQTEKIQRTAVQAYRALGLQVYSRVDVIFEDDGGVNVLEANTIPGMTEASLLPEAAAAAGISYPELCSRIIELSQRRTEGARP
jgi:D-alanine-D-alanine ligase